MLVQSSFLTSQSSNELGDFMFPSTDRHDIQHSQMQGDDEPKSYHSDTSSTLSPMNDEKQFSIDIEAQKISPVQPKSAPDSATMKASAKAAPNLQVSFAGPDDPENPKNWNSSQKWAATSCIAAFTFITPLASTMVAPALDQIRQDLNITSAIELQMILSIFVLAFAVGPMLLGPLSELYGRVIVTQTSNLFFLVFSTVCGFARSKEQLMAFRFLAGLGGSAPLAIGGGVIGDLFKPEERGKAMGLYAMGPLLGPAIGPIIGGWITERTTWRWMFWVTSIVNCAILFVAFLVFKETYAPYLLHKKAKELRKSTGNQELRAEGESDLHQPLWRKIASTMGRAFGMLFTQPIVQAMSLYMAFSFGVLYLMLSTFSELFLRQYHQSIGIAGLNYISLGLGLFIGAPICGKANDVIYARLKARDAQKRGRPEFRMPLIIPFTLLVPLGLLLYGWSAQFKTHWIVPNVGAFIFGIGTIASFQCVTTYLVDTYTRFAASAIAAVSILRSLTGFAFPLFAPAMYRALNYGWGNTVLAFAALIIGVPVPVLLWFYGESLRKRSSLAMSAKPPGGPNNPTGPGAPRTTDAGRLESHDPAQKLVAQAVETVPASTMAVPSKEALRSSEQISTSSTAPANAEKT